MALHAAFFGAGVGIILLDDVECVGNETSLLNCTHLGIGLSNCQHREDVSLLCQGEKEEYEGRRRGSGGRKLGGGEWGVVKGKERVEKVGGEEGGVLAPPSYSHHGSISCNLSGLLVCAWTYFIRYNLCS